MNEYEFIYKIHWPSSVKIRLNNASSQLKAWNLLREIHTFFNQENVFTVGDTKLLYLTIFIKDSFKTHCVESEFYLVGYQNSTKTSILRKFHH